MELLREELNKEINVNKKAVNKKLEEENIMVNRQIREIDGKCNQTFEGEKAVSYTHLDVYKRQPEHRYHHRRRSYLFQA